jgi:Zn-dependent peptidase ImmA (M78 family)
MSISRSSPLYGFKTKAEVIAESCRSEMGLPAESALDAYQLASHLGILVQSVDQILNESDALKLIGTRSNPVEFSALCMKNCDGDKIIIYNPNHSLPRQQSDLMHEIAHILRKHEMAEEVKQLLGKVNLRSFDHFQEEEAEILGGCLQITRKGLLWAMYQNYTYQQMADYFKASLDMVKYRIFSTGVEKQRANYLARK